MNSTASHHKVRIHSPNSKLSEPTENFRMIPAFPLRGSFLAWFVQMLFQFFAVFHRGEKLSSEKMSSTNSQARAWTNISLNSFRFPCAFQLGKSKSGPGGTSSYFTNGCVKLVVIILLTLGNTSSIISAACPSGDKCPVKKYAGKMYNGERIPPKAKCVSTEDIQKNIKKQHAIISREKKNLLHDTIRNLDCYSTSRVEREVSETVSATITHEIGSAGEVNLEFKSNVGLKSLAGAEISAGFKYGLSKTSSDEEKKEVTVTRKIAFDVLPHMQQSVTIELMWDHGEYKYIGSIVRQHNWEDKELLNEEGEILETIDEAVISVSIGEGEHSARDTVGPSEWLLPCMKCGANDPPDPKNN